MPARRYDKSSKTSDILAGMSLKGALGTPFAGHRFAMGMGAEHFLMQTGFVEQLGT